MSDSIRLAVIDTDDMVREGRLLLFQSQSDIQVVYESGEPSAALEQLGDYLVDLILVEARIPGSNLQRYLEELSELLDSAGSKAQIIAMANFVSLADELAWLRAGAAGVISHELGAQSLLQLARSLGNGDETIARARIDYLLEEAHGNSPLQGTLAVSLSRIDKDQTAVLRSMLAGASDAQIAKELGLTKYRVSRFLESIRAANGFRTRTQLAIGLLGLGAF